MPSEANLYLLNVLLLLSPAKASFKSKRQNVFGRKDFFVPKIVFHPTELAAAKCRNATCRRGRYTQVSQK